MMGWARRAAAAWIGCLLMLVGTAIALADDKAFPRPPELEPDVQFWVQIYSRVTTQGGLLHDDRQLQRVYDEIAFQPGASMRERFAVVETARDHYVRILRRLATGVRDDLSDDERRVLSMFPANAPDSVFDEAAEHVRFQLGQADRFREGVVRSGAWQRHVEETLRREGLPPELAALPHVESSFNPRAYSKVGAAGLWQFMRNTGKRWLRVDGVVDERLDPYKSTLAAAQFLRINYALLGSWPLAITAYNHGAGGVRRAKEAMGTDDIVTIVRNYQGRTFGFASRNYYVSFLAALDVEQHADRYFGRVNRLPTDRSQSVRLPGNLSAQTIARALGTNREALRELNLALLDPVWAGRRDVPRGFELRVPAEVDPKGLIVRLGAEEPRPREGRELTVTVARGETLDRIATRYGLPTRELASRNGVTARTLHPGMRLVIPPPSVVTVASGADTPGTPGASPVASDRLAQEPPAEDPSAPSPAQASDAGQNPAAVRGSEPMRSADATEPIAASALPQTGSAASVPASARAQNMPAAASVVPSDPADYAVHDAIVVVQGAETLGLYATWLGIPAERLAVVNHLKSGAALNLGQRVRLDLSVTGAAIFEQRRQTYHRDLQAAFFSRFRIQGTEHHRLAAGETLWLLTKKHNLPAWLLHRYNPGLDLGAVRQGADIVVPRLVPAHSTQAASTAGEGR